MAKIITTLGLKILPRDQKSKDTRQLLSLIFSQWLPLSTCVIQTIVDIVPPPSDAQRIRIPKMLYPDLYEPTVAPKNKLEEVLYSCDSGEDAPVVALVSKMFAVPSKELPGNKKKVLTAEEMRSRAKAAREARAAAAAAAASPDAAAPETSSVPLEQAMQNAQLEEKDKADNPEPEEEDETLLGFARIYSGTIRVGTKVVCVLPKYASALGPAHPRNGQHLVTAQVEELYTMMGRELVPVESVPAGNVFAVRGLEGKVWRNATLCAPRAAGLGEVTDLEEVKDCLVNMAGVIRYVGRLVVIAVYRADSGDLQAAPIVRVAVEPEHPADMPKLIRGLKLLAQADPCVETFQQKTGEHVILTAGELHGEVRGRALFSVSLALGCSWPA